VDLLKRYLIHAAPSVWKKEKMIVRVQDFLELPDRSGIDKNPQRFDMTVCEESMKRRFIFEIAS
jgi:hypothetical protein